MAEDKKDNSVFSQVAASAGFAKGAVKSGKALAGVAKGAAAGPYGMMASALWEGRKIIGKAIAAFCLLMFLPVIYVMMLPSLIFGADGIQGASKTVLMDSNEILENLAEAESAIEEVLKEKHDDVIKKIEKEAEKLEDGCEYNITDTFAGNIVYESSLVISQYCASKNNYQDISLWNLKWLLRRNLKNMFSYTVNTTTYQKIDEEADTSVTITHYEYTVVYTGSEYLAGQVFDLTESQRATAKVYARNLELFLNDMAHKENKMRRFAVYVHTENNRTG